MGLFEKAKLGCAASYHYEEFDGAGTVYGKITEVEKDHILMVDTDGITYFLTDDILSCGNEIYVSENEYIKLKEYNNVVWDAANVLFHVNEGNRVISFESIWQVEKYLKK